MQRRFGSPEAFEMDCTDTLFLQGVAVVESAVYECVDK